MFTIKDWEKIFMIIEFVEPDIKDHLREIVTLYDVSSKEYLHYPSDFIKKNGKFNHRQYNICLLRASIELPVSRMKKFLKTQCGLKNNPLKWLYQFKELLEMINVFIPTKANAIRFKKLGRMIEDQIMKIEDAARVKRSVSDSIVPYDLKGKYNMERLLKEMKKTDSYIEQIPILEALKAEYFREVDNAKEEDTFIKLLDKMLDCRKAITNEKPKLIPFLGSAIKLADLYVRYLLKKNKDSNVDDFNQSTEAERICSILCDKNGQPYNQETIRTNIGRSLRTILEGNKD